MTKDENGGPAFPREDYQTDDAGGQQGMTMRDYFAAKAMQAIVSKSPFLGQPENFEFYNKSAIGAYDYADAMLRARLK